MPTKKKRVKQENTPKQTEEMVASSPEDPNEVPEELAKIGITPEIVGQALSNMLAEVAKVEESPEIKQRKIEDQALYATISEFMDSFMLIGFRLDHTPVMMNTRGNPKTHEALKSLLLEVTKNTFNK